MNREEAKKKAEALVARMTLEEKASQLSCQSRAGNGFSTGDRNGGSF